MNSEAGRNMQSENQKHEICHGNLWYRELCKYAFAVLRGELAKIRRGVKNIKRHLPRRSSIIRGEMLTLAASSQLSPAIASGMSRAPEQS